MKNVIHTGLTNTHISCNTIEPRYLLCCVFSVHQKNNGTHPFSFYYTLELLFVKVKLVFEDLNNRSIELCGSLCFMCLSNCCFVLQAERADSLTVGISNERQTELLESVLQPCILWSSPCPGTFHSALQFQVSTAFPASLLLLHIYSAIPCLVYSIL